MSGSAPATSGGASRLVLPVLAAAQFLMVLDSAVMNVSVSQLVEDFDTDVATIQAVITFYALVMAALMITGGKLGDRYGRKRAFTVGTGIYAVGSLITAISQSVPMLALGWSVIEGIGAALVMPAMVALVAGMFEGKARAMAYGVLGGVAGAGIAIGPILGGWVTTNLSWRLVFLGEVVVALAILAGTKVLREPPRVGHRPEIDWVGSALSASGLALVVYGVLQSSTWGWFVPRNSPIEIFGLALTPYVILAGIGVLVVFASWERHREAGGKDPLVHLDALQIPQLRSGLSMFLAQNLILMGVFFAIPLYLQIVQGYDAFETGLRMLPVSITLFLASAAGPRLGATRSPRTIVRAGLAVLIVATFGLLSQMEPEIDTGRFLAVMAILGVGMGLIASQLGNVVQSAVDDEGRGEAGGLQFTAQQFGASMGTALIGAMVLGGLAASFSHLVAEDPAISDEIAEELEVALASGVPFIPTDDARAAVEAAGVPADEADAIIDAYEEAQLRGLRIGLFLAGAIVVVAFVAAKKLPDEPLVVDDQPVDASATSV